MSALHRRTLLTAALAAPAIARAQATRTLKFVPYTDLVVLDPVLTGNFAVRNHALMVFDTLYGVDDSGTPQPQMVEGHTVTNDGRIWTMTLRPGLRFHDTTPVLARDAVASISRWARRDTLGAMAMAATDELSAPDDRTIRFRLNAPFPLLPYALGKMVGWIMAVMPERLAATDPSVAVPEIIGSGPYRFLPAERLQGARNAYARFDGYVPRPDGVVSRLAGPKLAHFDRVEWLTMPDPATAINALRQGEVDWVEQPLPDLLPSLRGRPGITTRVLDPSGTYRYVRLNHLQPPFNSPAIRRAALAAISQTDILTAIAGTDQTLWRAGVGFFAPDSPMANDAGMQALRDPPDLDQARRLLAASGYSGEKLLMAIFGTIPTLSASAEVAADAFRRVGFNVETLSLETAAMLQRIASQAPVDKGGWSASTDGTSGVSAANPVLFDQMRAIGRKGANGWPDSPALARLREAWIAAPDLAAQKSLARQIQALCFEEVPIIPAGITYQPTAYSSALTGMLNGLPLFHNLRRG